MGSPTTWNIAEAEFIMKTNTMPGCDVDVVKEGGIDADGSIEVQFPDGQIVVKEDATGEYAQFNYLNSKKTSIKISTMHGSVLHKRAAKVVAQAAIDPRLKPVIGCTFKDPILGIRYTFQGGIVGQPSIKIQGTLDTIEVNLLGVSQPAIEAGFDLVNNAFSTITKAQNLPTSM